MQITLPGQVSYIIENLTRHGFEAYAVGGCVRDSILGRCPDDWDITTSASPLEVKQLFQHTVDTGIQHGTVTVMLDHQGFEVTTYRIDGQYTDSRHPASVEFTRSLSEDLKRRDFTINAMAYNDTDGLIDLFGGREDLENHIIRCVGEPEERFCEDALRILRAVRFAAQLDFSIDANTFAAARSLSGSLKKISAERIHTELDKLLCSEHPSYILTAYRAGITAVVLPEFDLMMHTSTDNPHHIYSVGMHTVKALECIPSKPSFLRWTMLLHDIEKPLTKVMDSNGIAHFYRHQERGSVTAAIILRRLKFDNKTIDYVHRIIKYHDTPLYNMSDAKLRRAVYKIGDDIMEYLFMVRRADIAAKNPLGLSENIRKLDKTILQYRAIKQRKECLSLKELDINGKDLLSIGVPPGKEIGEMLEALLYMVLDNPPFNKRAKLLARAKKLLEERAQ